MDVGYRRTVLVIWPQRHSLEMHYGNDPEGAIQALKSQVECEPRDERKEREVAEFLLRSLERGNVTGVDIIDIVSGVACAWEDLPLWDRTIKACGAETRIILDHSSISQAFKAYGINTVGDAFVETFGFTSC
jgi:hypothetical protein